MARRITPQSSALVPNSRSPDAVLQTVAWLEKQGFKAVALHPRSKAAVSKDYTLSNYRSPHSDLWRNHDYGVGCLLGPLRGGPVDVDLDCDEAIFFAPRFLPQTPAVFGRAGKPRSHYLYRVDTAAFDKVAFGDPVLKNATIIEARGDGGHQTVFPGSVHESSGEVIQWSGPPLPEVPNVPADQLLRAVRKIAFCTLCVRYVWQPGYHNEPTKHLTGLLFYLDWTEDEAVDIIEALMEYSGDDDKSRIPTVRATFRRAAAGKKVSGAGKLRKQLNDDRVIDKLLELAGSPTVNLIQEYNDRYAVVTVEGKFRIADTDTGPGEPPTFYAKEDFLNKVAVDTVEMEHPKKEGELITVSKGRVWLGSARRRSYDGIDFRPGDEDSDNILNLWTGWAVEPREGDCSGWMELLTDVICDGDTEAVKWLIHWFANVRREPMRKSLTAPVLIGVEGAGKSLLVGYFGRILGPAYTVVTNERHVYGQFNKHLATTLLLHSEEALYGGDRRHAAIVRSLITDEYRQFEPKGIDAKQVRNYLRLIMLSNSTKAAPTMPGDRRYSVFDLKKRKISDALLKKVLHELDNGGPAALCSHLLTMNYDPSIPRVNLKNEFLAEMKTHNFDPLEAWWYSVLQDGQILPDQLAWATKPEKEAWPTTVGSVALFAYAQFKLRESGARTQINETSFALHLNKYVDRKLERQHRQFSNECRGELGTPQSWTLLNDRQSAIINLPSLPDARSAFERYVGQQLEWPENDDQPRTVNVENKRGNDDNY